MNTKKIKSISTTVLTVIMILAVITYVFTCAFAEILIPSDAAANICYISIATLVLGFCSVMAINLDN